MAENYGGKNMKKLKTWKQLLREEDGMGTVEIILIIVVIFTIYMGCK